MTYQRWNKRAAWAYSRRLAEHSVVLLVDAPPRNRQPRVCKRSYYPPATDGVRMAIPCNWHGVGKRPYGRGFVDAAVGRMWGEPEEPSP